MFMFVFNIYIYIYIYIKGGLERRINFLIKKNKYKQAPNR